MVQHFEVVNLFLQWFLSFEFYFVSFLAEDLGRHLLPSSFALDEVHCCETSSSQALQRFEIFIKTFMGESFLQILIELTWKGCFAGMQLQDIIGGMQFN